MTSERDALPINHDWLDTAEQRAQMAESVTLPIDQFLALIAVARNGLRPKQFFDAIAELTERAGKKPNCDCIKEFPNGLGYYETCDCHNGGDHAAVAEWCALMNAVKSL